MTFSLFPNGIGLREFGIIFVVGFVFVGAIYYLTKGNDE